MNTHTPAATSLRPPRIERDAFAWCAAAVCAALMPLAPTLPTWFAALVFILAGVGALYGWRQQTLSPWLRLPLTLGAAGAALFAYNFGFGRDTGAALLSAMLAMKLLETRHPRDGRSVLSYALFAIMAGFLQDQSPRTFVLAVLATTLVLAALARIAQTRSPPAIRTLRGDVGSRIWGAAKLLALSLPLAIVGFFLFPRLASPLWGLPGNAGEARTGLSNEMTPGDISQLFADDSPALRVQFDGPAPPQSELYWRGPVLTGFDGRTWSRWVGSANYADVRLPNYDGPEPEPLGPRIGYEIVQEPTDRRYAVALDLPLAAPQGMKMAYDGTLYVSRNQTELSRYRAVSVTRYRFEPNLLMTLRSTNTQLPDGFNPRTAALVSEWSAENPAPEALAQRALELFNAEFTYTLDPQLLGRDSVDDFLFNTQQGYCEHFASAFVVMMRMADIPARVVTGYQGAQRNDLGDYWVVRHSDAHAWAEIWLEGRGWVRIDPTSAVSPARIERGRSALSGPESVWGRIGKPLLDASDWLRRNWNDVVLGFDAARQRGLLEQFGLRDAGLRELGLALAIGVGLALAITLGLLLRGPHGPRDPLRRAYAHFLSRLARAGVQKAAHEGPLAFAQRAAAALPPLADEVQTLSQRYARRRYAADVPDTNADAVLRDDLRRFRVPKTARARRSELI